MMEIKILNQMKNPLLNRKEVEFSVFYKNEATPTRIAIRNKLAALVNEDSEKTIIRKIQGNFGEHRSTAIAYIYLNEQVRDQIERKHILKRFSTEKKENE